MKNRIGSLFDNLSCKLVWQQWRIVRNVCRKPERSVYRKYGTTFAPSIFIIKKRAATIKPIFLILYDRKRSINIFHFISLSQINDHKLIRTF